MNQAKLNLIDDINFKKTNNQRSEINIKSKAFLASVSIGRPRFNKKDKVITSRVQSDYQMDVDRGAFIKVTIPKTLFLNWDKETHELRSSFDKLGSPWSDDGFRIYTSAAYLKLQELWSAKIPRLEKLKAEFLDEYDVIVGKQKEALGHAFNESDYPSRDRIASRFYYKIKIRPLPETGDFRVTLSEDEEKRIIEETKSELLQSNKANFKRLFEAVNHLATTTADEKKTKKCKNSTLDNVKELIEIMPLINFMEDPVLTELSENTSRLVSDLNMKSIKKDSTVRTSTAQRAEALSREIQNKMNSIF